MEVLRGRRRPNQIPKRVVLRGMTGQPPPGQPETQQAQGTSLPFGQPLASEPVSIPKENQEPLWVPGDPVDLSNDDEIDQAALYAVSTGEITAGVPSGYVMHAYISLDVYPEEALTTWENGAGSSDFDPLFCRDLPLQGFTQAALLRTWAAFNYLLAHGHITVDAAKHHPGEDDDDGLDPKDEN